MSAETSELLARIAALESLANELEQLVIKLQERLAAAEQSVSQRWV